MASWEEEDIAYHGRIVNTNHSEGHELFKIPRKPVASSTHSLSTSGFDSSSRTGLIEPFSHSDDGPPQYDGWGQKDKPRKPWNLLKSLRNTSRQFRYFLLRSGRDGERHVPATTTAYWPYLSAWKMGVFVCCVGVGLCLILELALLIAAVVIGNPEGGLGLLLEGSCARVKTYSVLILVPFNIIGTVLVSCSNYVMQCLSAPTRAELKKAHARGVDVNIGVSSMRNSAQLASIKQHLWWIIGLSTIPIHLMLNSVVVASLQANNYAVVIAGQEFQTDDTWSTSCASKKSVTQDGFAYTVCQMRQQLIDQPDSYRAVDVDTCIRTYSNPLSGTTSNAFLITNTTSVRLWDAYTAVPRAGHDSSIIPKNNSIWAAETFRGAFESFRYSQLAIADVFGPTIWNVTAGDRRSRFQALLRPNGWMCEATWLAGTNQGCDASKALEQGQDGWSVSPQNITIDRCVVKSAEEHCTLQYSLTILVIIVLCDVTKLLAMLYVLRIAMRRRKTAKANAGEDEIIATLGDAIQFFLEEPDETSRDRCLVDASQIRKESRDVTLPTTFEKWYLQPLSERIRRFPEKFGPRPLPFLQHPSSSMPPSSLSGGDSNKHAHTTNQDTSTTKRWASVPSRTRWGLFIFLFLVLGVSTAYIMYLVVSNLEDMSSANIWSQGVGRIDPNAVFSTEFFSGEGNFLRSTVVINLPQLLFSYMYFAYNGLFTCMHTGHEWSQFAPPPRLSASDSDSHTMSSSSRLPGVTLRTSSPIGFQRSTYWLSLPWRYSLSLITVAGLMHWLVSRSLFLVRINVFDPQGERQPFLDISACGYSPLAIILVATILGLMVVVVLLFANRKLNTQGMPVVGTNSWAISGCCHDLDFRALDEDEDDVKPWLKPLLWGAVDHGDYDLVGDGFVEEEEEEDNINDSISGTGADVSTGVCDGSDGLLISSVGSNRTTKTQARTTTTATTNDGVGPRRRTGRYGHCTITSRPVERPLVGRIYQ